MSIQVACRCGHRFRVKDKYAGKTGKCPACGSAVTVPDGATLGGSEAPTISFPVKTTDTRPVSAGSGDLGAERARLALEIQKNLLPKHIPDLAACELAGVLQPAALTGGDYYDFFPLQDGSLAIAIGDASGHGPAAALLIAEVRVCLRALAQAYSDVGTIFTLANRVFAAAMPEDIYATLTLARLDLNSRMLTYASAGHPTAYVVSAQGKVKWNLESTDCPLGLLAQTIYGTSNPLLLEPGEIVLFLTNGILKSRAADGTMFGAERACAVVEASYRQSASAIAQTLCQSARTFGGTQIDDLTAVVVKSR